jgi:hypothetical protein
MLGRVLRTAHCATMLMLAVACCCDVACRLRRLPAAPRARCHHALAQLQLTTVGIGSLPQTHAFHSPPSLSCPRAMTKEKMCAWKAVQYPRINHLRPTHTVYYHHFLVTFVRPTHFLMREVRTELTRRINRSQPLADTVCEFIIICHMLMLP